MCTNTWIKTYTIDYSLSVKSLDFSVSVEFVKIANAKGEVGVGEEFDGFSFLHTHEEGVDVLLDSSFLKECGKSLGILFCLWITNSGNGGILLVPGLILIGWEYLRIAYDDAAWPEIVFEGFALTKELWREKKVEMLTLSSEIGHEA